MPSLLENRSKLHGTEFALPDTLGPRCVKSYGSDFTTRALQGYRLFMKIKKDEEDWDAILLSPSPTIDLVWHQHILDVKHYVQACSDYCGQVIGHNPEEGLDQATKAQRNQTMISLLFDLGCVGGSNPVDKEIWLFGDADSKGTRLSRRVQRRETFPSDTDAVRKTRLSDSEVPSNKRKVHDSIAHESAAKMESSSAREILSS